MYDEWHDTPALTTQALHAEYTCTEYFPWRDYKEIFLLSASMTVLLQWLYWAVTYMTMRPHWE